jgi:hypothetical protein
MTENVPELINTIYFRIGFFYFSFSSSIIYFFRPLVKFAIEAELFFSIQQNIVWGWTG